MSDFGELGSIYKKEKFVQQKYLGDRKDKISPSGNITCQIGT